MDKETFFKKAIACGAITNKAYGTYVFEEKWLTGGITGGNCWNSGGHRAMEGDPEPQMHELDNLLEQVCPNISFLVYKKIENSLKRDTEHKPEYYGNSSTYGTKYISLDDLYNIVSPYLIETLEIVNEEPVVVKKDGQKNSKKKNKIK